MGKDKDFEKLRKAHGLIISAPIVLQGVDVLKARSDSARLSQIAGGTLQVGITGRVGQIGFDLAANPFRKKRRKRQ